MVRLLWGYIRDAHPVELMTDRKRAPPLKLGIAFLSLGFATAVLGLAYGWGCDFDTMDVCRPFGFWTGGSFLVAGTSGLLVLAALGLGAVGGLLTLVGLWRVRPGNIRSNASIQRAGNE
jgi:hypothetical protein